MKLRVSAPLLAAAVSHASAGAPEEVCGWLAGMDGRVSRVYPVPNVAEPATSRFRMDPELQFSAMREIHSQNLELTATYHSHCRTPAIPSARDASLTNYPDTAHLIISLLPEEPEVRCYRVEDGELVEVELAVEEPRRMPPPLR